jgi:Na+-driven multidrug efflux pump
LGFGQAACTIVGNNVGMGKKNKAKGYVALGMIVMQLMNLIFSTAFFFAP